MKTIEQVKEYLIAENSKALCMKKLRQQQNDNLGEAHWWTKCKVYKRLLDYIDSEDANER